MHSFFKSQKTLLRYVFVLAVCLLVANLARLTIWPKVHAQVALASFANTVIMREIVTDAAGVRRPAGLLTRAIKSDGSRVERLGPAENGGRRIVLPSGVEVITVDSKKMKTTTQHRRDLMTQILDPATDCTTPMVAHKDEPGVVHASRKLIAKETIAGYRTAKVTTGLSISWHAIDHGCAVIAAERSFGDKGKSQWELVALIPGEPDARLFAIPENFTEVAPSATFEPLKDCNAECQARQKVMRDRVDANYHKNRAL